MTDAEEKQGEIPKEKQSWFMTLAKVTFFFTAFLLVIFTVMANMGGSSDTLKSAIEEYMAGSTGYEVEVETLNKMTFFPSISIDIERVRMFEPGTDFAPVVTIGRLYGALGFRSVAFSAGEIKAFDLDELHAQPGVLNSQAVFIENIGIVGAEDSEKALLQGRGKLGVHDVSFQVEMEIAGDAYKFGPDRPFELTVGDLNAQGYLADRRGRILLQDLKIGMPDTVISGKLDFIRKGKDKLRVGGDVRFGVSGNGKPDLLIERVEGKRLITGAIEASVANIEDIKGEKSILAAYKKFRNIFGYESSEEKTGRALDLDIELTTESGCIHLTSKNIDVIIDQLSEVTKIPSAQQVERYPCSGP
ncbi:MAG: hypothetical protein DHS20C02_18320 [Micavibrio sp.]|nr:MAG: hypothetical protein DHS20C02_18320 [Micavibrio sp.]